MHAYTEQYLNNNFLDIKIGNVVQYSRQEF